MERFPHRRAMRAAIACITCIVVCVSVASAPVRAKPDFPTVSTFAGSGVAGIIDGPATLAQFIAPAGLAFDRAGNAFVADAAAQRIRKIDTAGNVTTVAGSGATVLFGLGVPGGYLDGPAATARFDTPSGIAVADNGDVYVADTGNNCIRRISARQVTTFAGHPIEAPPADGPPASATFHDPRSIAFDAHGNLLVADVPNGIREIDSNGNVSTISFEGSQKTIALTTYHDATHDLLFAASPDTISFYDLATKQVTHTIALEPKYTGEPNFEGHEFVGPASSIAALGQYEIVYADNLYSTIRYIQAVPGKSDYTRDLTLRTALDAARISGSFADGPGDQASFDQPMAIAVDRNGRLAVADTGNRRIRTLGPFDRRQYGLDGDRFPTEMDPKTIRIAIVGASIVWTDVSWSRSIAGVVERSIANDPSFRASGKRLELYPLRKTGATLDSSLDFAENFFTSGIVDVGVVLFFGPGGQYGTRTGERKLFEPWAVTVTARFKSVTQIARASHVRILAAFAPFGPHFFNEETYYQLVGRLQGPDVLLPDDPGLVQEYYDEARTSLQGAGVDLVDLWPAFASYEKSSNHQPIVGSWDVHYTTTACRLIGEGIAARIIAEHPWSAKLPTKL